MKRLLLAVFLIAARCSLHAQVMTGDALGSHDMSPSGTSPVRGGSSASCLYCHAPHSGVGGNTPLWAQTLSTQVYTPYASSTEDNASIQPALGADSSLCLSCHDGTVAVGTTVPSGQLPMGGAMYASDVFGTDLTRSHPFSFKLPLKDSPDLVQSLVAGGVTNDPLHKVKLVNGNVECTSCHEPHVQSIDPMSANFLVRDSVNGQLCLSCHEPNDRQLNGQINLADANAPAVQKLTSNLRALNIDLADLFPPILQVSESPAVARELLVQMRLLQSTIQVKLNQFSRARRFGDAASLRQGR